MQILGYEVKEAYPDFPVSQTKVINTINPHSYCVAKKDSYFREALQASDLLIPDGTGIVWASQVLEGKKIRRITGDDMHKYLLNQAQRHGLKVFYMGASVETLNKIEERIQKDYTAIQINSYSPPYKASFSKDDNSKMREAINTYQPDILFVGMTAPKQEKWVHQNKEVIDAKIICSIGAVFDFYAGTVKRPGLFWQKIGLEWLPRFLKEPRRLARRNFISTPVFIFDVLKAKIFGTNNL